MRLPSVEESRVIFSPSSEPPWLNMSSNACSRAASISRTASPRGGDDLGEVLGAVAERVGDLVAARDDRLGDAGAGLLELGDDVAAAQVEVEDERVAGRLQRAVDLVGAGGDRFGEPARGVDDVLGEVLRPRWSEAVGQFLRAAAHHVDDRQRFSEKPSVTWSSRAVIMSSRPRGDLGEFLGDVVGLEVQARGERSLASAIAREVSSLAVSRRSSRSPPRSPSAASCCRRRGRARA